MKKGQARNIEIFKVGAGRIDEFGVRRQQRETRQTQPRTSERHLAQTFLTRAEEVANMKQEAQLKAERRKRKAIRTS